jgi:hypothetical protein
MAYRKSRSSYTSTKYSRRTYKPRTRMGKVFRTRKGKLGCYKYVNGRRVAFVRKSRKY